MIGCASNTPNPPVEPSWLNRNLEATGIGLPSTTGNPAQNQLMAQRASQLDARVSLWKQIENLPVDEKTVVANYLPPYWMPSDITEAHQKREDGSCSTTVQISLRSLWEEIKKRYPQLYNAKNR